MKPLDPILNAEEGQGETLLFSIYLLNIYHTVEKELAKEPAELPFSMTSDYH